MIVSHIATVACGHSVPNWRVKLTTPGQFPTLPKPASYHPLRAGRQPEVEKEGLDARPVEQTSMQLIVPGRGAIICDP